MGDYSEHRCDENGARVGVLEWPPFAAPGRVVRLDMTDLYGRVRLVWRCCGAVLVEMMAVPDDPECADTYTFRATRTVLAMPDEHGPSYSVPCLGAAWSLNLPCGHLAGEGCDCDTIAAEAL